MRTQRIVPATFIVPLLAMLYGCQPGESGQPSVSSAPAAALPTAQRPATNNAATASAVSKEDFTQLAKDIGCFACHSIEKKLLGPSWKSVAMLYRSNPAGETLLTNKIVKGGGGVWGNIEMPAYPDLDKEKIRTLVTFILALE